MTELHNYVVRYAAVQFGVGRNFLSFWQKKYLMLSKADQIYSKINKIVEYDYKIYYLSVLINFKMESIPVILKLNFQQHYSSLQCHMILQIS